MIDPNNILTYLSLCSRGLWVFSECVPFYCSFISYFEEYHFSHPSPFSLHNGGMDLQYHNSKRYFLHRVISTTGEIY